MVNIRKGWLILFIISCLCTLSASALDIREYSGTYSIIEDKVIVEEQLTFSGLTSEFSVFIPLDAVALEVEGADVIVLEDSEAKEILLQGEPFNAVSIKYITESLVERNKESFFILDLGALDSDSIAVKVILPEKATLRYRLDSLTPSIIPTTELVTTDGKSIVVEWTIDAEEENKAFLIMYEEGKNRNGWYMAILIALSVLGFLGFAYFRLKQLAKREKEYSPYLSKKTEENEDNEKKQERKQEKKEGGVKEVQKERREEKQEEKTHHDKEKTNHNNQNDLKEQLTRNLFEEERAIIEILLEKGELWQKQLVLLTGISKVKLSRKLRNLEAKGLIEKIPYGNTNKIRIRKG